MINPTINCNGKLISLDNPLVMGIVNVTPDSFFEGSRLTEEAAVLKKVENMLNQGAAIIDVGAQSSRPGADRLDPDLEWRRLAELLPSMIHHFPEVIFSIDTFFGSVAKLAIEAGVAIINDISAGSIDDAILNVAAEKQVPYILMHMQGDPQTMQIAPTYDNVVADVVLKLSEKLQQLRGMGINDVIIDPGFGFGKTLEQNYQLLAGLKQLQVLGCPILAGLSRKSMIYKLLGVQPEDALNGTTALNMMALQGGAKILRVHDVKEATEAVKLFNQLRLS